MSALAYLVRLLKILLAAGLFAGILFADGSRSQAMTSLDGPPTPKENFTQKHTPHPRRGTS